MSNAKNLEEIQEAFRSCNPDATRYAIGGSSGMLDKFVRVMKEGDHVISYDPSSTPAMRMRSVSPESLISKMLAN